MVFLIYALRLNLSFFAAASMIFFSSSLSTVVTLFFCVAIQIFLSTDCVYLQLVFFDVLFICPSILYFFKE